MASKAMEAIVRDMQGGVYFPISLKTNLLVTALINGAPMEFLELLVSSMKTCGWPIDRCTRHGDETPLSAALASKDMRKIRLVCIETEKNPTHRTVCHI